MTTNYLSPDYLFEVSWEVCNKVGGIHTVISTKALSIQKEVGDNHILIGPDVWRDTGENPEFEEDKSLFSAWRQSAAGEGLRVKTGRWKIAGRPIALILDFTPFMSQKDAIFSKLWESFKLDSISGQWDYIEPALFGYAAGKLIESFTRFHISTRQRVIAQFHEWMCGGGLLYLKDHFPQVATVFTTHATVIGRSIAGNQLPLYGKLNEYDGDDKSNDFNVTSKQSMEKLSAQHADAFTTVSSLTAMECAQFLKKEVDVVTPNGFEDSFVPQEKDFDEKRKEARKMLLQVARKISHQDLAEDALLIATSGRYEYRNKGLDVFTDALGKINALKDLQRDIVAFYLIPAHHYGARKDLLEALSNDTEIENKDYCCLTHHLHHPESDPVLGKVRENQLVHDSGNKVHVVFVPSYLQGDDGVFNVPYFDLLPGFDLTVFASYYEPWGYTPLESLAFKIPTVTTTLAGFGRWVKDEYGKVNNGITVVERDDDNYKETVEGIALAIQKMASLDEAAYSAAREEAWDISRIAEWKNLVEYYWKAYDIALSKAGRRTNLYFETEKPEFLGDVIRSEKPDWKKFVVNESVPSKLRKLELIASNLYWSWNPEATELFRSIDPELWEESHYNPILAAKKFSLSGFRKLENDKAFLKRMDEVYEAYSGYLAAKKHAVGPKIAYFSMEYGLHDSVRIYSGGLGLLAGDYLKEASDSNRNMVGIGILYRYGYFTQIVSSSGEQIAVNEPQYFEDLPVAPVRDESGNWITISLVLPGRIVKARIWRIDVGRIELYLLDTDFEENLEQDRSITHHLYGGDNENRLKQELILGIGGIRALEALGIEPDLYHCNEGHAAFIGLERLRMIVNTGELSFPEALEWVRATTLYTTHTPVPAGHDSFEEGLVRMYMSHYPDRLRISWEQFIGLGRLHPENSNERFSMSYLAINLSQEVNGVSRLHGKVTQEMFSEIWKGYTADELHIGYVTNGVHFPSWIAPEALAMYQEACGDDFILNQSDFSLWENIYKVDSKKLWTLRNNLRMRAIQHVKDRLKQAIVRKLEDPRIVLQVDENLREDVLTIGFARRFATYKRAHLIFRDLERLAGIVNHPERPVQFLFAGKAHPNDKAGQDLIKMIVDISKRPEFMGKIIFLQGYDISLAKKLLQGVDVWLNTPTRPLEASGTSGEKAIMNGSLHFSVLDGWWAEGYQEGAGWALEEKRTYDNQNYQDELDAETLYSLLENEIAPLFYNRDEKGVPRGWVQYIKNSMVRVAPRFTMKRMLTDYEERFYGKLYARSQKLKAQNMASLKELAAWKKRTLKDWNEIRILDFKHPDISRASINLGDTYQAEVTLELGNIASADIGVELVIPNYPLEDGSYTYTKEFEMVGRQNAHTSYRVEITPARPGLFEYGIRIYARHEDLPHRQDFALVKWA
jgi:phosphorylase/glycogen(starch) synthase